MKTVNKGQQMNQFDKLFNLVMQTNYGAELITQNQFDSYEVEDDLANENILVGFTNKFHGSIFDNDTTTMNYTMLINEFAEEVLNYIDKLQKDN